MNTKLKKILITISSTLGAVLFVTTLTYAVGTLIPVGSPGDDTQYTINEIAYKLTDFSLSIPENTGSISVPGGVAVEGFNTLSEIYALLENEEADIVPEKILDGVEIFGIVGVVQEHEPTYNESYPLSWTSDQGLMSWYDAKSYCASLNPSRRLPTMAEIIAALNSQFDSGTEPGPGDFSILVSYWTSSEVSINNANAVFWSGDYLYSNSDKNSENQVRCVK